MGDAGEVAIGRLESRGAGSAPGVAPALEGAVASTVRYPRYLFDIDVDELVRTRLLAAPGMPMVAAVASSAGSMGRLASRTRDSRPAVCISRACAICCSYRT